MKVCPCGMENENDARFCDDCGRPLVEQKSVMSEPIQGGFDYATERSSAKKVSVELSPSFSSGGNQSEIKVLFDKGRATFLNGTNGAFRFQVLPKPGQAIDRLRIILQLPSGITIAKPIPYRVMEQPASLSINFSAGQVDAGHHQSLDCYIDAMVSGQRKIYFTSITFDILSRQEQKNITIQGGINFTADRAADQRIEGVNIFGHNENPQERISSLRPQLEALELNETSVEYLPNVSQPAVESQQITLESLEKTLWGRSPQNSNSLSLELSDGRRLHLYSGFVRLGRAKDCELVTRNFSYPERLPMDELKRRNLRISSVHAGMELTEKGLRLVNGTVSSGRITPSRNGVSVNGHSVRDEMILDKGSSFSYTLAPGSDFSTSFRLEGASRGGAVVLLRSDDIPESYLLLEEFISLNVLTETSNTEGWYLLRSQGSFAVSNGRQGYFLTESGLNIPGIRNVSLNVSQVF